MQFTADIIARQLGGIVEGDGNVVVSNFAKIESAQPGTLTFLANPKYTNYIYTTGASIVLVSKDFVAEHPISATLIRVEDPYGSLAMLLNLVATVLKPNPKGVEEGAFIAEGVEVPEDAYVGAFSYIGEGARLGKGVKIYPHSYIGPGVVIGDNTTIYSNVSVYYGCRIGNRCTIHSGAVVGADGFGFAPDADGHYQKIEQIGIVVIDDDVEIGANTCIDRSTLGATHIAKGVKLDNLIQLAHNVEIGEDTVMAAQAGVAGSTKIGSRCMVGGQVGFAGHITVGDNVVIGAQTGIPGNVKSDQRLMGYPAMPASAFARLAVYQKQLPELYARVAELEKYIKELKNEKINN